MVKIYHEKCLCCNEIRALKGISFDLNYGEIFGFLGVNGAGKTTTFKCLANEIIPDYGNIYINNLDVTKHFNTIRNLIGYCPQYDAIFDYLTVFENLKFYGLIKGAKKEKLSLIINSLIDIMNLTEFKNSRSENLSGGNKRKLSVAIALICNPPIILLDEPSTGMDPEARRHMWKAIYNVSLNRKKSTIIMTTHSMEEAESLCKKIGILVDGEFKCLGTSDEIKVKFGYGFEIKVQLKNPDEQKLFEALEIKKEDINDEIDTESFEKYFDKYNKIKKYKELFKKELFGKKLFEEINTEGYVYFKKIIVAVYYLKCSLKLMKLIQQYFEKILCVEYKDNNFTFYIKRNKVKGEKTIGFLFGLIEENKNQFNIGQYFLQYSSLEYIFNMMAKNRENIRINDDKSEDNIQNNDEDGIEITKEMLDCI